MSGAETEILASDTDPETGNFFIRDVNKKPNQLPPAIEKDLLKICCCYAGYGDERDPEDTDKRSKEEIIDGIYNQVKENPDLLPAVKSYCQSHHDSEYAMSTVYQPLLDKLSKDHKIGK